MNYALCWIVFLIGCGMFWSLIRLCKREEELPIDFDHYKEREKQ